jgi:hypothetical protein
VHEAPPGRHASVRLFDDCGYEIKSFFGEFYTAQDGDVQIVVSSGEVWENLFWSQLRNADRYGFPAICSL